uniref:Uncharacterized protein n=1 Tax=Strombidium inclinatum TaxID=197538 RepID=A0A7S3ITJ3_9SPIT|mmetsp:Transcript_39594/g.60562  ORF Transcript_39594/g.60562 Transcript_39594/m.60562 type:complete len:183 (+) Transcript_39594:366-914(+)
MKQFGLALGQFIVQNGFSRISILSSTMSPVKRGRDTNRQIPEVYAYVNNHLYQATDRKFYDKYQVRKFGHWIGDAKKKPHQELDEMYMGGSAKKLMKALNYLQLPAQLFVIFSNDATSDFVGGYSFYMFLKGSFTNNGEPLDGRPLSKIIMEEPSGVEIYDKLFTKKSVKTPVYWKKILEYY